jgi:integrase
MKGRVFKRGKTYTYVLDIGKNPLTNKRQRASQGGFRTKGEAQAALAKIQTEYNEGSYIDETEIKLSEFCDKWLGIYESTGKVKISTIRVRKHEIGNIKNYFKEIKLKDVTGLIYQSFLIELNKTFATNTLKGIHRTARMIFKKAIELKLIKEDPTEYAEFPKKQKTVEELEHEKDIPKYFEKNELKDFLDCVEVDPDQQYYAIFVLLAYTGMRIGELCALKWKDIDFNKKEIRIYKTYYNPGNNTTKYTLLTPKTKQSKRTITIDDFTVNVLKAHKAYQNRFILKMPTWYREDFVFTKIISNPGYPELPKQIGNKMSQLVSKHGFTKLTPHGLRHTHTSLLAQAGVSLEEIMERLGHKDDKTTRDIYLHVTKEMKKTATHKFSNLMAT